MRANAVFRRGSAAADKWSICRGRLRPSCPARYPARRLPAKAARQAAAWGGKINVDWQSTLILPLQAAAWRPALAGNRRAGYLAGHEGRKRPRQIDHLSGAVCAPHVPIDPGAPARGARRHRARRRAEGGRAWAPSEAAAPAHGAAHAPAGIPQAARRPPGGTPQIAPACQAGAIFVAQGPSPALLLLPARTGAGRRTPHAGHRKPHGSGGGACASSRKTETYGTMTVLCRSPRGVG